MGLETNQGTLIASFGAGRPEKREFAPGDVAVFYEKKFPNGRIFTEFLNTQGQLYHKIDKSLKELSDALMGAGIQTLKAVCVDGEQPGFVIALPHAYFCEERENKVVVAVLDPRFGVPREKDTFFVLNPETNLSLNAAEFEALKAAKFMAPKRRLVKFPFGELVLV